MSLTVAQLVARLSADTSGFYKGMAVANASLVRTGGLGKKVMAGMGLATLAMGYMAVRSAGDFQQSMNILQAVSGATGNQLDIMRKKAIALGADLKLPNTSAKDAADAMVELSKGGLSVNQILTATRGTIQLSLAANEDLATSSQVVARALKAFGLSGDQATTIANLLAAAANKSTAEFSDLELGIQNASAQFTGAGYNIQTLTVALAELADRGLNGSIAGTSLKYMLQRLESPTTKAAAALKQMNISIADSHGKIRPLPAIIGQFQRAMEKMTPIQKQQALNLIFGQRANAAMFKLVQGGVGTWNKYTHAIVGNHAAQKMAEARTKGFNGALQGFQSAIETLFIQLGTPLLGGLTRAVHGMSIFIESLNVNAINAFVGGIFHIIGAVVGFIAHSTTALSIMGALLAGFLAFKTVMSVIAVFKAVQAAIIGINAAMYANPVALVIGAVIALAAGLFILYQRSATFRTIVNAVWEALKNNLVPAFHAVVSAVRVVAGAISSAFSAIKSAISSNLFGIRTIFSTVWNVIVGIVRTGMATISAIFRAVWPVLKTIVQSAWGVIKSAVSTGIRAVKAVVDIVMGLIKGDWSRAWHGLVNLVVGILTGLGDVVSRVLHAIVDVAFNAAKAIGSAIKDGVVAGARDLGPSLANIVTGGVSGAIQAGVNAIKAHSPSQVSRDKIGKPIADGIIVGFLLGIRDLPAKMNEKLRAALQAAQQTVSAELSKFQDKFSRFTNYVDTAFDAISAAHLGPKGKLLQQLITAHDQAQLKDALNQANSAVKDAQDQLFKALQGEYATSAEKADAIASAEKALSGAVAQQKEAQYQIRITALQKEADEEDKQYQARRNLQKQHLDDLLMYFEAQMAKHPARAAYWQGRINAALQKYGVTYQESGRAMGLAFATGMREAERAIMVEIRRIAAIIARYLRLHSPAAEGPLSDLDRWWEPFARTLVSGLDPALIRSAALSMAQEALVPTSGGVSARLTPVLARGATSANAQIIVPVSGNTFLTNERETLRALSDALATVAPKADSRLQMG